MSDLPNVSTLIRRVGTRLRVAAAARSLYRALLTCLAAFLLVLLVSRLTALIPTHWISWQALAVVPALAALAAVVLHRRPTVSDSARRIDQHSHAKDLFLTVARLDDTAADYQDLVRQEAEQKSQAIRPDKVVPYSWESRSLRIAVTTAILLVAMFFVPQLDPFGRVEAAEAATESARRLDTSRKATAARAEQLKSDKAKEGPESATDDALRKLLQAMKKMRPQQKDANRKTLLSEKSAISKQYRAQSSKQLREMLSRRMSDQDFGGTKSREAKEWMKQLQAGRADKLMQAIDSLQADLRKLSQVTDPAEKKKLAREIRKRMQDIANFAGDKAGSKELTKAITRAMEQLEAGRKSEELSEEALQAAADSLDLSKMELENLAKSAEDLQKLEQALEAIQAARRANEAGQMNGADMEGVNSLADYASMYAEQMGEEPGPGNRGQNGGIGEGGAAEESDDESVAFQDEHSKQRVQEGKVLTLKTKGLSDSGEVRKQYAQSIRAVKKGVSEAIDKELVPPGYVDGIKKYFDNIKEEMPERPAKK